MKVYYRKLTGEDEFWARGGHGAVTRMWNELQKLFTWPTTLHSPSQCTDANQRRMEGRDETFVHEATQTAVSWISEWQRKLMPGLSWCDISCLRRLSVTKLHFIFAFGRYISRGLLSGWRRPSKCSRVSRIVTAGSIWAIFLCRADRAGVIHPGRHRSGCGYNWQWTCSGISHSFNRVERLSTTTGQARQGVGLGEWEHLLATKVTWHNPPPQKNSF